MRLIAAALVLAATIPALAQSDRDRAYRDCSPHRLSDCQDSNQLFFASVRPDPKAKAKTEFPHALSIFLSEAPKLYARKYGFAPAQVAQEGLTGPGEHHDHLPGGGWFFDGFTPHDSPDRGAVLFGEGGAIVAVALVNTDTDAPGPTNLGAVRLRIYCHDRDPTPDQLKLLRDWAKGDLIGQSLYPGALPVRRLAETTIIRRDGTKWSRIALP